MTKIKKLVVATVAAVSRGAMGITAFAASAPDNYYKFSLEGRDDLYFGISSKVDKSDWVNPAVVKVTYGSLNATNRASLSVTGESSWPESYVMSEEKTIDSITGCELKYKANYVVTIPVYLLATTGDDVKFEGYWKP